jgi:hypothetical protein
MIPQMQSVVQWLYDDQIVVFTLTDVNRSSIDLWRDAVVETLTHWPRYMPQLSLFDVSSSEVTLTPYLDDAIQHLGRVQEPMLGRYALLTNRSWVRQLMEFRNRQFSASWPNMEGALFSSYDSAVAWLKAGML